MLDFSIRGPEYVKLIWDYENTEETRSTAKSCSF